MTGPAGVGVAVARGMVAALLTGVGSSVSVGVGSGNKLIPP